MTYWLLPYQVLEAPSEACVIFVCASTPLPLKYLPPSPICSFGTSQHCCLPTAAFPTSTEPSITSPQHRLLQSSNGAVVLKLQLSSDFSRLASVLKTTFMLQPHP
ncbi:hypothetical protein B0H19DRAFT_1182223 [Mycena capillaripes]|nr:hypothetical protein B0H19DRAFT_1182223 [Mycena capillaripes]